MPRTLEIIVAPTGDISIEAVGFKGADCEQATRFLEEALGQINRRERKREFHQPAKRSRNQQVGS